MVLRTYKTGLSLTHFPCEERKNKRHKLADIIEELSDESLKHARKFSKEILNYLIDNRIEEKVISAALPKITIGKGKFGVNELMKKIGIANNHLHSSYHLMANSAKGYLDRVFKFQKVLEWFKEEKLEMVKWVLWQRSTYQINEFKKRWGLSFHYIDPLMRGAHKRYFKDLPCFLREISLKEFIAGLQAEIFRIEAQEEKTEGTKSFLRSLYYLQKKIEEDPEIVLSDLAFIPTGWKNLKLWVENLGFKKYGLKRWASVIRSVLSQVYFSDYEEMINKIYTAKVTKFFKVPFTEYDLEKKKQIPYLMVSGPNYVIKREKNTISLEMMRHQGYFYLRFKFLKDGWNKSIEVRVKPSRKMRQFIDKDVKLKTMIVLPPQGPARDVDIQLVFEGKEEVFISTKHLDRPLKTPEVDAIAIDINRRGKYAVVSSLGLPIPEEISKLNNRWNKAIDEIKFFQSLLAQIEDQTEDQISNDKKRANYQTHIELLYLRMKELRKTYHQDLANWLGRQMVYSEAKTLVIEDLSCHTYGTRKALAKAIESMADETKLYTQEVLAVSLFTHHNCELVTLNARNSSRIHVDCGGQLQRDLDNYDIAPCSKCKQKVNTHTNAASFLLNQFRYDTVHSPVSSL